MTQRLMRLLHVFQTLDPATGGPVESFKQRLGYFRDQGWTIDAVSLDNPDAPFVASSPVPVTALGRGLTGYGYSRRFVEWLKANATHYDCVIVHGLWGFPTYGTWLALRGSSIPYLVFPHGMLDPWFKRTYPLKHVKKWIYYLWAVYPALRDAGCVLFTCEKERCLARQSFAPYQCNEVVIRYGTSGIPQPHDDYASAFFAQHPMLRGKQIFLFLGRVHPKKGPDLLIRAIASLQKSGRWESSSMQVVIAGPSDGQYAQFLRNMAQKDGVSNSIYWTGMLEGHQKWGALQAAEAFVLPSHQENFGIAIAESLSAGVPVLITHSVNIAPEIEADGAGFAERDTVRGCIRLFERWLALNAASKVRMKSQARLTFERRYTSAGSAEDLAREIIKAVKNRPISTQGQSAPLIHC